MEELLAMKKRSKILLYKNTGNERKTTTTDK